MVPIPIKGYPLISYTRLLGDMIPRILHRIPCDQEYPLNTLLRVTPGRGSLDHSGDSHSGCHEMGSRDGTQDDTILRRYPDPVPKVLSMMRVFP